MPGLTRIISLCAIVTAVMAGLTTIAIASDLSAKDAALQDAMILSLQPKIKSNDFRVRAQAFAEITRPLRKDHGSGVIDPKLASDSTKHAVTELLSYEFWDEPPAAGPPKPETPESAAEAGEFLAAYAPALIQAVMELHDPGSIPLLYKPDILMSGSMATAALAYFGKTEAGHIVDLYEHTQNGAYKDSLKMVILSMLSQRTIDDPELRDQLEPEFFLQTYSPHPGIRTLAAMALSYFPDAKTKARLADMAAHDPWVRMSASSHQQVFAVRNTAALALRGPISQGPLQ